jgi:hypothetical protein
MYRKFIYTVLGQHLRPIRSVGVRKAAAGSGS